MLWLRVVKKLLVSSLTIFSVACYVFHLSTKGFYFSKSQWRESQASPIFNDEKFVTPGLKLFQPGTDVMILKIFSPKNLAKKLTFLTQNKAKLWKILIITLIFEKNANFFAENCRKSQKIVIITSNPGANHKTFTTTTAALYIVC
jgi:hypothetical protein